MKEKILSSLVIIAFITVIISGCSPNSGDSASQFQESNLNSSTEDTVTESGTEATDSEMYDLSNSSAYQSAEHQKNENSEQQTEHNNNGSNSEEIGNDTVSGNNTASSPADSSVESSPQEEKDDTSNIGGTSSIDWEDNDVWGPRG